MLGLFNTKLKSACTDRFVHFSIPFVLLSLLLSLSAAPVNSNDATSVPARGTLRLRGGDEMVPPATPLSGLVNGPLPNKYAQHFRRDGATPMNAAATNLNCVVTSTEAQKLLELGILKGKWAVESEEEPSSDVQVPHPCRTRAGALLCGHGVNQSFPTFFHLPPCQTVLHQRENLLIR